MQYVHYCWSFIWPIKTSTAKQRSTIFNDPLIQQIRENQENQESAVDKIRRKREERRRREGEAKVAEEEKKAEMKSEDPNERRTRARAEREKIAQGEQRISIDKNIQSNIFKFCYKLIN